MLPLWDQINSNGIQRRDRVSNLNPYPRPASRSIPATCRGRWLEANPSLADSGIRAVEVARRGRGFRFETRSLMSATLIGSDIHAMGLVFGHNQTPFA